MRVNPNPYPDLLADIEQTQQEIQTDEQEIATGQTVNLPSDNPAAAATLVQNASQTSETDQFERSLGSIEGEMQNADSALNSVISALQQAITLGTEGANGTVNAADRDAIATQVQGIQSQLLGLANLTYQGTYVFAGTASLTQPYALDASSPSGVTYQGNSGVNTVTLGNDFSLQTNLPGPELFSSSGTDMFQSIQDLIATLQSGNNISTAVTEVGSSMNAIDTARVFYGNALNQLNSQQTYLSSQAQQLSQEQNTIDAADLPNVISNLTTGQVSLEATLETIGQTSQTNLFDYLR